MLRWRHHHDSWLEDLRHPVRHAFVATLPIGARTVFVLHDVEGWEHGEIAAATGIATGTSKAQLHRARRLLQGVLTP